jgi:hypothetical protein
MSLGYGKKEIKPLVLSKFNHGYNSKLKTSDVGDNYKERYPRFQCVPGTINMMLDVNKKRPPVTALNSNISGRVYGMHFWYQIDGTETFLIVVGQKFYYMSKTTGVLTELFDFGSAGEAYFVDILGKCFVTNSVKMVKVEGGPVAYQVGITAPAGVTAAAKAGGTLPAGVYKIYAGYARKVGGVNVLFSKGQSITDVTLSGGNGSIAIASFANSSDAQVGNKIIWMTDADLAVYYLYHETGDNTTTSFDITSESGKKTAFVYTTYANNNDVPLALQYIGFHNQRLWGLLDNVGYYSLQEQNVYDLERFKNNVQKITLPYDGQGLFSLSITANRSDLYFNTPGGLIRLPYGDPNVEYGGVGANQNNPTYFTHFRTVAAYGNLVMGVTSKTFGIFDGEKWYPNDFSRDIKPDLNLLLAGSGTENQPCGTIVRKNERVEYHLAYRDRSVSDIMNNRRLVLNLDELKIFDKEDFIAPWEPWNLGANYFAVDRSDNIFCAQAHDTRSIVYKDRTNRDQDANIYIGDTIVSQVVSALIRSGTVIPALDGITKLELVRTLAKYSNNFKIRVQIVSRATTAATSTISPFVIGARFGIARFGKDRFPANVEEPKKSRLSPSLKGYAFYVEIIADSEDEDFQLLKLWLMGYTTKGQHI